MVVVFIAMRVRVVVARFPAGHHTQNTRTSCDCYKERQDLEALLLLLNSCCYGCLLDWWVRGCWAVLAKLITSLMIVFEIGMRVETLSL